MSLSLLLMACQTVQPPAEDIVYEPVYNEVSMGRPALLPEEETRFPILSEGTRLLVVPLTNLFASVSCDPAEAPTTLESPQASFVTQKAATSLNAQSAKASKVTEMHKGQGTVKVAKSSSAVQLARSSMTAKVAVAKHTASAHVASMRSSAVQQDEVATHHESRLLTTEMHIDQATSLHNEQKTLKSQENSESTLLFSDRSLHLNIDGTYTIFGLSSTNWLDAVYSTHWVIGEDIDIILQGYFSEHLQDGFSGNVPAGLISQIEFENLIQMLAGNRDLYELWPEGTVHHLISTQDLSTLCVKTERMKGPPPYHGSVHVYRITIENQGDSAIPELLIGQSLPQQMDFEGFPSGNNVQDGFARLYFKPDRSVYWKLYAPLEPKQSFTSYFVVRFKAWDDETATHTPNLITQKGAP